MEEDEEVREIVGQWLEFLRSYASGQNIPSNCPPPQPPVLPNLPTLNTEPTTLMESTSLYPRDGEPITYEIAKEVARFYTQHRYLPPPRSVDANTKDRVIMEYDVFNTEQMKNFERCGKLARTVANSRPVAITLFKPLTHNTQVVMAVAGSEFFKPGDEITPTTTLCSHLSLRAIRGIIQISSTRDDWRFERNPWVLIGGVNGFVGVPIFVPADPADPTSKDLVPIGVINIFDTQPIPPLSDEQTEQLLDLSDMLSSAMQSTWEGWHRSKEAQIRDAATKFLEYGLVKELSLPNTRSENASVSSTDSSSESGQSSVDSSTHSQGLADPSPFDGEKTDATHLRVMAVTRLRALLDLDFAVIIDLHGFHPTPVEGAGRELEYNWIKDPFSPFYSKSLVLASSTTSALFSKPNWEATFSSEAGMTAIATFLTHHSRTSQVTFDSRNTRTSGLETLFPQDNVPHMAIPFFNTNKPAYLIIVANASPLFTFAPSSITLASNFGVVLVARDMQEKAAESAVAQTTFVSRISHELLTPLHGIMGQISMMREAIGNEDFHGLTSMLNTAEECGTSLKDIVKNIVGFGRHSTTKVPARPPSPAVPTNVIDDLPNLTELTVRQCYKARKQGDSSVTVSPLELTFTHDACLGNQKIFLDDQSYTNVVENLVDNALKFTREGSVRISLQLAPAGKHLSPDIKETRRIIVLEIQDTGIGMTKPFLNGGLFHPFRQASGFGGGTGLGLYLTKSFLGIIGGDIKVASTKGTGTTVTVSFPATFASPLSLKDDGRTVSQCLSLEPVSPTALVDSLFHQSPFLEPRASDSSDTLVSSSLEVRILVVDDNLIARKLLLAAAKNLKAVSKQACDGDEAVDIFKTFQPHIVWTDVSMPRMDGVTASRHMRRFEKQKGWEPAYIVAMTAVGFADTSARTEALLGKSALDEWLVKGQSNWQTLRDGFYKVQNRLQTLQTP
ncbi:hypothetical protein DL96DRAFT_1812492 [Flagelloscypha sp. PMI_526]|nr:hypothetical protein DL96DRAFT_1812492 [Flagelloscypha sp. PMI_526]